MTVVQKPIREQSDDQCEFNTPNERISRGENQQVASSKSVGHK